MSDMPDRALLEAKERDELLQIAAALGIEVAPRARKGTIIGAILGPDGGAVADQHDGEDAVGAEPCGPGGHQAHPHTGAAVRFRGRNRRRDRRRI